MWISDGIYGKCKIPHKLWWKHISPQIFGWSWHRTIEGGIMQGSKEKEKIYSLST
jgi:hypothetical protein